MRNLKNASNSGDRIELKNLDNQVVVWKKMPNSNRAGVALKKQKMFNGLDLGAGVRVEAVKVIDSYVENDCLHVYMPYVEGIVAEDYAFKGTKNIGETISRALSLLLYHELMDSVDTVLNLDLIKIKIKDILVKTLDEDFHYFIRSSMKMIESIKSEIIFPLGPCHGDLTLSNVILSSTGSVKLIDFLDSYIESPLQDVAKIRQEFDHLWSFRKLDEPSVIKGKIFCDYSIPRGVKDLELIYPLASVIFSHMVLLRIAPYVKDVVTKNG